MGRTLLFFLGAAALAFPAASASACTRIIPPGFELPREELEANARDLLAGERAVLEVRTLPRDPESGRSAVRVLRVLSGRYRAGQVVEVSPAGSPMCGPSRVEPGQRGIVLLDHLEPPAFNCGTGRDECIRRRLLFFGFLEPDLARAVARVARQTRRSGR